MKKTLLQIRKISFSYYFSLKKIILLVIFILINVSLTLKMPKALFTALAEGVFLNS